MQCLAGLVLRNGGFLLFTNDDLSPFDFHLRSAQYVVVSGCTFGSKQCERRSSATALVMAGERCLFMGNTVSRPNRTAVFSNGKEAPDFRPYWYDYRHYDRSQTLVRLTASRRRRRRYHRSRLRLAVKRGSCVCVVPKYSRSDVCRNCFP